MLIKVLISTGLVSAGLLLILLTTTTPTSAGAFGILAIFLLSYVFFLVLTTFTLWFTAFLVSKITSNIRSFRRPYSLSLKKSYYFSTVIALGPVLIVSLRSVGGVGVYEFMLILLFIGLGCLYVSRRTA